VRGLRNFFHLPAASRLLLIEALVVVWAIRLCMWLLPFRIVQRALARLADTCVETRRACPGSREIPWAVTTVSRYVPTVMCLPQALAAQFLLARRGTRAQLRIGVAKGHSGRLEGHAWLESDGKVIFGELSGASRFTPFPPLGAAGS